MAFAETANLAVKLTLGGNFTSQLKKATSDLKGFNKDASRGYKAGVQIGTGIKRGVAIGAAGLGVLVSQVGFGLDSLVQLEDITAQTNAVLKSTGGVAGQTSQSIRDMANNFESLNATIDDKVIQSGENLLLTFTNIRKAAFEPALAASLDMATAMHQDLQPTILQVGKALNDPIKGVGALRRVGVQLNDQQQKQITTALSLTKEEQKHYLKLRQSDKAAAERYKAGQIASRQIVAQRVILAELNKEFGGSFLAGGQTTAGKVAKFGDAIDDLQRSLATALLPTISNIADALTALLKDPEVQKSTEELGKKIGELFSKDNIKKGIDALRSGFGLLKDVATVVADVVGKAVGAFTSLPPEIQKLLVGGFVVNKVTGGLVTNILGGIVEEVGRAFGIGGIKAPLVNVQGGVVNVGGPGGIPGVGGGGGGLLGLAGKLVIPVAIASIAIGAAKVLTDAIDPGLAAAVNDPTGAHGTPLGNRDPRRFNSNGQVVQNFLPPKFDQTVGNLNEAASQLRNAARDFRTPKQIEKTNKAQNDQEVASQLRNIAHAAQMKQPVTVKAGAVSTTVKVGVSVTAGGIKKTVTVQERYGPAGGSRSDNRHLGYTPGGA